MEKKDTTKFALISYAVATEVEAVNMYSYLIKTLGPECREVLSHIMQEEKEHAKELIGLLHGKSKV